ncbi:hypothetical protein scyTo_0019837, partial [Scyliorhinus torazame]|nr:hypothetical protein [Scyliorhinus torazame]
MSEDTRISQADFRSRIPQVKTNITQMFDEVRTSQADLKAELSRMRYDS